VTRCDLDGRTGDAGAGREGVRHGTRNAAQRSGAGSSANVGGVSEFANRFVRRLTSSVIYHPDGTRETTKDLAVWTLAHRRYSGGGRLDIWVYPTKAIASREGAKLAMAAGLDEDDTAIELFAKGRYEAVMSHYERTHPSDRPADRLRQRANAALVSGGAATLRRVQRQREGGVPTVARTVTTKQAALAKARERRLALDAERDARDRRVEEATAAALVLLEQRASAESAVSDANAGLATTLRKLLADGVGPDGVASLVGLDVADVRRLTRSATGAAHVRPAAISDDSSSGLRAGAASRPGSASMSDADET
jgi:hypothetical protein